MTLDLWDYRRRIHETYSRVRTGGVGGDVLDFNYAYHPSSVHSDRWSCPLAPPDNRLGLPVTAGERLSGGLEAP